MDWQPIESAPKGTEVFVWNGVLMGEAFFDTYDKCWKWIVENKIKPSPTHWMPLPEAPK